MNIIKELQHGIVEGDWDIICNIYQNMTGQKITPPITNINNNDAQTIRNFITNVILPYLDDIETDSQRIGDIEIDTDEIEEEDEDEELSRTVKHNNNGVIIISEEIDPEEQALCQKLDKINPKASRKPYQPMMRTCNSCGWKGDVKKRNQGTIFPNDDKGKISFKCVKCKAEIKQ